MTPTIWGCIALAYVVGGIMGVFLAGMLHSAPRDDLP